MDHQRRWLGQFGDAVERRLQCRVGVGVRLLVEPDMAVADLHKREAAALGRYCLAAELQALRHAADHCPHEAGAGPSHALQHPPPVRIYIAFFGHSSLLVAIGVWVMSAICLCDNSSSSRRISGSRSSTGNAAISSCTCRSPRRRSSAISGSSSVASEAEEPGTLAADDLVAIGTNCTPRSSWRDE